PSTGEIVGISDDSQDSRVFIFEASQPGAPFRVDLRAYFPLPFGPGAPAALDSEGVALTRSGHLFISSEGLPRREPRVPPAIVEYTRRVDYVGPLTIPSKFLQPESGPITHGVRDNEGFEALTLTPDEQRLFTASETSLAQDGEGATFTRGTTARLLEFVSERGTFVARREFPYPLDPVPAVDFTPRFMINGLVELLALGDTEFLSMERGYAEEAGDNGRRATFIRIFRTSLDGATDISATESIRGRSSLTPVRKRLVLDLNAVKDLPPELRVAALDNFEGICFGPTLADGGRTLLIVSDDNFSPRQRTWFLLFRIVR
ncbi:MAG TPA: esterase-like activity of phytase family protein, partial [Gemmatimonadaceae bacterium]